MIRIETIAFDHDTGGATTDALTIRRNATQPVSVPEWRRGISVNPEDSPAAYARGPTRGNTLRIAATFSTDDPTLRSAEIRAVDAVVDPRDEPGCLGWLLGLLRRLLRAIFGNVLGEPVARTVQFPLSVLGLRTTEPVLFDLAHTRLAQSGVGMRTTEWRWQYRLRGGSWTEIEVTRHRVYVVLDMPTAPWQQGGGPGNTQLPWTEVLDVACTWAILATTTVEAATKVTHRFNALGPSTVAYDCPGGGSTHYAGNISAFLERMRGGVGNGYYVNCSDCATMVSTFANALGADLWQSRMGWGFALNPFIAIGGSAWFPGCEEWHSQAFNYHEVAWTGACTENDVVYDGCLAVDGDSDPTSAPHTALLATNMRFGFPGDGSYRDRLATPGGRPSCAPQTSYRTRRVVS